MSEFVSFRDFEILVMAESAARAALQDFDGERAQIRLLSHFTGSPADMNWEATERRKLFRRWLRARAKVIRAAVLLDPKDLEAEPTP